MPSPRPWTMIGYLWRDQRTALSGPLSVVRCFNLFGLQVFLISFGLQVFLMSFGAQVFLTSFGAQVSEISCRGTHGGVRPFHQKPTCRAQLILGPNLRYAGVLDLGGLSSDDRPCRHGPRRPSRQRLRQQ